MDEVGQRLLHVKGVDLGKTSVMVDVGGKWESEHTCPQNDHIEFPTGDKMLAAVSEPQVQRGKRGNT